ncbi:hypothetical protein, partial [Schnuerera sp.]|uniref:hypothetical protein n=1 Tax=Schnuerera sp. TaxID=2794844 RepID=UPI002D1D62EC
MSLLDSLITGNRARSEKYAKGIAGSEGLNLDYISTDVGVLPPDYVAGSGLAFGQYPVEEDIFQRVRWDFDKGEWIHIGAPQPSLRRTDSFFTKKLNTVKDFENEIPNTFEFFLTSTPTRRTLGYNEINDGEGSLYYWSSDRTRQDHNGLQIISPTWDNGSYGNENDSNWFNTDPNDDSNGVWIRLSFDQKFFNEENISFVQGQLPPTTEANSGDLGLYQDNEGYYNYLQYNDSGNNWDLVGNKIPSKEVTDLLQEAQTTGVIGYNTKSDMDADTSQSDQTIGVVMNDSTASNNGYYRWDDSAGSWVKRDEFYANTLDPADTSEAVTGKAVEGHVAPIRNRDTIYSDSADGDNITNLVGIKDLIITNTQAGKVYTVTSVSNDGSTININIFRSDDEIGTNYASVLKLSFSNDSGYQSASKQGSAGE